MGSIQSVEKFKYTGKAYNLSVTEAGKKDAMRVSLFDGLVHPDFIVYNNSGLAQPISEIKVNDIILYNDDNHWLVCDIFAVEVDEDFHKITLDDGRVIKCSSQYRFTVTSPKKLEAKYLSAKDVITDASLSLLGKKIRSTLRS